MFPSRCHRRNARLATVFAGLVVASTCLLPRNATAAEPPPSRVARVFILAGQSNMEGQAVVDLDGPSYNEGKGTLAAVFRDSTAAARLTSLPDGGAARAKQPGRDDEPRRGPP